jgi:Zn-dependent protease/CBS domain-containing protein
MSGSGESSKVEGPAAPRGSRWAFQIGSMLGIPIRIHATFVLILIYFGMAAAVANRNVPSGIALVLAFFACILLHELGHAAMARRFGIRTREIVLYPIGGIARLESIPGGWAELAIALAGPAVNVVLAVACAAALYAFDAPLQIQQTIQGRHTGLVQQLLGANILLVVFNMIPAFPMDGGRVFRALLAVGLGQQRATRIAAFIGQAIAGVFVIGGLFQANLLLAFIGVFVFLGASQEVAFQTRREAIAGHVAHEAMITKFETLAPQDTLGRAAELLLATHQHDFPVIDAWNRIAGVLPRARLLEGLAASGRDTNVLEVMLRDTVQVAPATDLEAVLQHLQRDPATPLLVVEEGALRGMVTLENLAEFIVVARQIAR